jgi:CPA2 family monovalent cation:H+ antiporter-2
LDGGTTGYLPKILVLLISAIAAVLALQRFRITPVLGYLVAGVIVGPSILGLVANPEDARNIAEYGVVFLLFAIGLDLPLQRLQGLWRDLVGLGLGQVIITAAVFTLAARGLGMETAPALVIGAALAFSSTATVLQILRERAEIATRFGRVALAILLLQDIAVVPLLALLPLLHEEGPALAAALGLATIKATAALVLIFAVGRLLLRPIYRAIAATRNHELFTAANLLVVLGTAWLTARAGMSMELGAFLAGLLLAETEFRHQVEADIQPFRGIFLGLFFISVGMTIDLALVAANLVPLIAITVGMVAAKAAIVAALCMASGQGAPLGMRAGLTLAQGGEFAFVVFSLAAQLGVVPFTTSSLLTAAVAISIAATPILAVMGRRCAALLKRPDQPETEKIAAEADDLAGHIVIAGFGRVGRIVGHLLAQRDIPFVAIDADLHCVEHGRRDGAPVYFGDAGRPEILRAAGIERAIAAVITLDEPEAVARLVRELRRTQPDLKIIVRSRDTEHGRGLREAGAAAVVLEALEPGLQIAAAALKLKGLTADEIAAALDALRANPRP